jgi:hypothetical protein
MPKRGQQPKVGGPDASKEAIDKRRKAARAKRKGQPRAAMRSDIDGNLKELEEGAHGVRRRARAGRRP